MHKTDTVAGGRRKVDRVGSQHRGHAHTGFAASGGARWAGRLWATFALLGGFMVIEAAAAWWTGSLALLSDAGYRVELAHDRQSLLLALDRATPAVILADSLLPGLEWNELHSELQRRHLSVHLIVMGVHDTGPALPGVSYLTKPLEATSLLAAIRSILVRDKV